ncbi:hypothetical protein HQO90_25125 [Rhodococcus fascians]|nr:hypothetical protein [Rhodococcus fascians]MBY4061053.1 hypothetical protein [Rhodococcus fascians]MBY4071206.1 hypothetical protein [Rhodococcus fascians]
MTTKPDLAALKAWIEDCITHLRDAEGFDVNRVHKEEFLLLYGVAARVMGYGDAYLRLSRGGLVAESVVLARAAIEHAVTLQWSFIVDGGVNRFQISVAHDRIDHYTKLAVWLNNEELAKAVASLDAPPPGKRLPKFMSMLRDIDKDNFLESSYHILSQTVHVTHSTVTAFLEQGDEELHIKYKQEYGYHYQASYIMAVSCMLARWVIAKLTNDTELLEILDKKSDDLVLPMNLLDGLELSKRRAGL